jgi:hypothetical protein
MLQCFVIKKFLGPLANSIGTVVEHSMNNSKLKRLNPIITLGSEKMMGKVFLGYSKVTSLQTFFFFCYFLCVPVVARFKLSKLGS